MTEHREFIDGKWMTEAEAIAADRPAVTREEFEDLHRKVSEIHSFLNGIAGALNNPMIKAMIPPQMRAMLPDGK